MPPDSAVDVAAEAARLSATVTQQQWTMGRRQQTGPRKDRGRSAGPPLIPVDLETAAQADVDTDVKAQYEGDGRGEVVAQPGGNGLR